MTLARMTQKQDKSQNERVLKLMERRIAPTELGACGKK